jgi:hypothetical protein
MSTKVKVGHQGRRPFLAPSAVLSWLVEIQQWYVNRCIAEANKQGKIDRNSKNELAPCFARGYMKVGTQDHSWKQGLPNQAAGGLWAVCSQSYLPAEICS